MQTVERLDEDGSCGLLLHTLCCGLYSRFIFLYGSKCFFGYQIVIIDLLKS